MLVAVATDLDELHRAGQDAWPDLAVTRERYAIALATRDTTETLKGADLYLAVACIDGDERAIQTVNALLAREVKFAAAKTTATKEQIEDVTATVARQLFVDEPERPSALRTYSARGSLESYLHVIAKRELVRVVNSGRREVGVDESMIDYMVPRSDPEISMLRERYRHDVDEALEAAMTALEQRDRALLRYAFVDGLNVDAIGKLYDVHRATAARWIAAAREQLAKNIRTALAARLKISVSEVDSIVRLVQSRIDVSLESALGS